MNKTQRMPKIPVIKHKPIDNHQYDNYELFFGRKAQTQNRKTRDKTRRIINDASTTAINVDPLSKLYITEKIVVQCDKDHLSTIPTDNRTDYHTIQTDPEIATSYLLRIEHSKLQTEASLPMSYPKQLVSKTRVLNTRKESVKDFISKTREMILMKYTTNIKKERAVRLKETYENEIESIKDTIDSMKQAKTLFNENFYVKFGDYVKHLAVQREQEKGMSANLLEEIIKQKNELLQIQNKIKKQESDKSNAIRWFFFQIQVKEKKQMSFSTNILMRINEKYKNGLVFNTPEDFLDELKKFEMQNVIRLNEYNDICSELQELKKEKNSLINEDERSNRLILSQLEFKQKELEQIMRRTNQLVKEKTVIEKAFEKENTITHRTSIFNPLLKDKVAQAKKVNHSKLMEKITSLYKTTQAIQLKREFQIKKLNSNEIDILEMLEHIEHSIDFLIGKFEYYQSNKTNYKLLRTIQSTIEKEHKMEKGKCQREEEENRFRMLKEKIEERNNKTYYIPKKKVDNFAEFVSKKKKKNSNMDNIKTEPTFEDFMYDLEDCTSQINN